MRDFSKDVVMKDSGYVYFTHINAISRNLKNSK